MLAPPCGGCLVQFSVWNGYRGHIKALVKHFKEAFFKEEKGGTGAPMTGTGGSFPFISPIEGWEGEQ